MPNYDFPVPRPRGLQGSSPCGQEDPSGNSSCVNGVVIYPLLGRYSLQNGDTYELETIFNPEINAIDIDVPDYVVDSIETIGIGPNTQRYFSWLFGNLISDDSGSDVSGLVKHNIVPTSIGITASWGDLILCDASGGGFTINLPTAVGNAGKEINIKKIDSTGNQIIVNANGTEEIDGQLTQNLVRQYENITIVSDGSNFVII